MAQCVAGEQYRSLIRQLFEIGRQLHQPGGYPFDPTQLQRHLQAAIEGRFSRFSVLYPVIVIYGASVEEMVKLGQYGWSNEDITSNNFPTNREGTIDVVVELIHFGLHAVTDEALRELDGMGYRPAELHELLAFGAKYPDIQREFPVVALGSVWQDPCGSHYAPVLFVDVDGSRRRLGLGLTEYGWASDFRFAAVRK